MKPIYLDYAATTPVDPRVVVKMQECLGQEGFFGNPASTHCYGQAAHHAIELARQQVADLIHAQPSEIIWTSGATEANNLALKGAAQLYQQKGKHIVTVKTEHPSILDTCQQLEKLGFQVTYLTPENNGLLGLHKLAQALRPDTILVSVMHVNNEIGTVQDIQALGKLTRQHGILLHVDAAQSAGKIPIDVDAMQVDLMSFCAHKVYGPKGVGALYLRKKPRVRVAPQIMGGGHESGMRSGTLATHQIVGMGAAFALAKAEMQSDYKKIFALRERFIAGITAIPAITLNSETQTSSPYIINLQVKNIAAEVLMNAMPELAISSGSACHAKGVEPSYVLRAIGLNFNEAKNSVRISIGRFTTSAEIEKAVEMLRSVFLAP